MLLLELFDLIVFYCAWLFVLGLICVCFLYLLLVTFGLLVVFVFGMRCCFVNLRSCLID